MDHFDEIREKLEAFIKRYYASALIKGALLFFCFGLLYILFWSLIESFFWFSATARAFVFWSLISFEAFLFIKFLLAPFLSFLRFRSGIDHQQASKIIGDFFPEIKDKLLNAIQLNSQPQSEFITATIQQKTQEFKNISFKRAVRLRDNLKYSKYAFMPLFVIGIVYASGSQSNFREGLSRVVDYKTHYTPPAPFKFIILNESLKTIEKTPFFLNVKTEGRVVPDKVEISFAGQSYFLKKVDNQLFQYRFLNPTESLGFSLSSGDTQSPLYQFLVLKAPKIVNSQLLIDYPPYTKTRDKRVANFSNVSVPEGTTLTWSLTAQSTENITFSTAEKTLDFTRSRNNFFTSKQVFSDLAYTIQTNNSELKQHETLSFNIRVKKDQPPSIRVMQKRNESNDNAFYFYGQLSDDYGISNLEIQYYPKGDPGQNKTRNILFDDNLEFVYDFPNDLDLLPDTAYEFYFEVFDNDPFPKPNSTKTEVFTYLFKSNKSIQNEALVTQKSVVQGLEKSVKSVKNQNNLIDQFTKEQLQKDKLSFNDKEKISALLRRQQQQDDILRRFNKQMEKTLKEFSEESPDPLKEELIKRVQEQNQRLEEDEMKLQELEQLAKKIQQEGLMEKLKKLGQQSKNKQRSLQQMLELTKRYYVSKKAEQLKRSLEELADKQQALSNSHIKKQHQDKREQDELNKTFAKIKDALDDLRKQNNSLKTPLSIPDTQNEEESIQNDQQDASNLLEQSQNTTNPTKSDQQKGQAQKAQKKAAQKMRQLAHQMSQNMAGGASKQNSEDAETLRQILDNLLVFSFEQEGLMNRFVNANTQEILTQKPIKKQMNLKTHFEHIDDSLFMVSLRQPMISESINKEISDVYFNIDKALNSLSENRNYEATAAQQYAITSTNNLANMLSDILDKLEMQLQPSPGQGDGDMQLPDIIMSQEDLQIQAEEMMNGKKEGKQKPGKQGEKPKGQGKGEEPGSSSKNGREPSQYSDPEESGQSLFELYKQQQKLRQALERALEKEGLSGQGKTALESIKKIEQMIVNQGVSSNLIKKMQALNYEFLKLNEAVLNKGQSSKRQSQTNKRRFTQGERLTKEEIKRLFNSDEILNRKPLPLRKNIKKKVERYFNAKDDQL